MSDIVCLVFFCLGNFLFDYFGIGILYSFGFNVFFIMFDLRLCLVVFIIFGVDMVNFL